MYSCSNTKDDKEKNDFHFRGTALGGWLVLEPWLTPSLFYQFLGATEIWGKEAKNHIALDTLTFCHALGPLESNRQLKQHWKTWVNEDQIKNLAIQGVEHLRVPVGDWMFLPYGPYVGCFDGAIDELDRAIKYCEKYNITIIIDIHGVKGSQNGLDNSGNMQRYKWIPSKTETKYEHWNIRGADWIGAFDRHTMSYTHINTDNLDHTLQVISNILDKYANNPQVIGIEPVNEPWEYTPLDILQEFYWKSYLLVQSRAPHWITLFHDSFRLHSEKWFPENFMNNCNNYAIDTHIYQAWSGPMSMEQYQQQACLDGQYLSYLETVKNVPVVVGEWSLATDNCATWLNGLNDNLPGYPKVECSYVQCPAPYMNDEKYTQPKAPPDPLLGPQEPFGTGGVSNVVYGMCPRDMIWNIDNEYESMRKLAMSKLNAYDMKTHGFFFWNFRTEFEPKWDYQQAVSLGWLPSSYDKNNYIVVGNNTNQTTTSLETEMIEACSMIQSPVKDNTKLHTAVSLSSHSVGLILNAIILIITLTILLRMKLASSSSCQRCWVFSWKNRILGYTEIVQNAADANNITNEVGIEMKPYQLAADSSCNVK